MDFGQLLRENLFFLITSLSLFVALGSLGMFARERGKQSIPANQIKVGGTQLSLTDDVRAAIQALASANERARLQQWDQWVATGSATPGVIIKRRQTYARIANANIDDPDIQALLR